MDALLYIEKGLPYHVRRNWGRLMFIWSIVFLVLAVNSIVFRLPVSVTVALEVLFLIFLAGYMANASAKFIFLHKYRKNLNKSGKTYEVWTIKDVAKKYNDDVSGLINSSYGDEIMKRLGISRLALESYLEKRPFNFRVSDEDLQIDKVDLPAFALIIHDGDEHFASYLRDQRVNREDLFHAARLVQNISALQKQNDRIWSKAVLHRLSPFEEDVLNIEKAHDIYFTSPVIRKLSSLDDEEKLKILREIISNAKKEKRREIRISDIDHE